VNEGDESKSAAPKGEVIVSKGEVVMFSGAMAAQSTMGGFPRIYCNPYIKFMSIKTWCQRAYVRCCSIRSSKKKRSYDAKG
jgi:hypothetical protein